MRGCACSFFIRIGFNKAVFRQRRALEHVAIIIRTVCHLIFGGDRLDFGLGKLRTTGLCQIAKRNLVQPVATGANFLINLKTAAQRASVIGAERPSKAPVYSLGIFGLARGIGR